MDLILLEYTGGRPSSNEVWNRKRYVFNKENNFMCDVPRELEQWLAQNAQGQYQVVATKTIIKEVIKEVPVERSLKCGICDFIAKTEHGLVIHKTIKHSKKGGK